MKAPKVTKEQVEEWLGTSNPMSEAIEIIQEIANEEYEVVSLQSDILEYVEDCGYSTEPPSQKYRGEK